MTAVRDRALLMFSVNPSLVDAKVNKLTAAKNSWVS
jgi:hypothetical protein